LILITLAALLLRVWTIHISLPYVDHPDEPNPITYVIEMLRSGDPNQRYFQKPSLFVYLILAVISLHYHSGLADGTYAPISSMVISTYTVTTVPVFFLLARWVSALFGALSVVSVYALGLRGWNRTAGLAGAVFVAVLPYHLQFSQWATTDITSAFLTSLSLGAALLAARRGFWRDFIAAGAFAGLAASTKYNAGIVALAIAVAAVVGAAPQLTTGNRLTQWRARLSRLAGAGFTAMACFVAGTPYVLLSWEEVSGGIIRQWGNYSGANGHYRGTWNIGGYLEFFSGEGLGWLAGLAVIGGLGILARRDWRSFAIWMGFAASSFLLHLSRPTHFMQNMLPLLVACALPLGIAVDSAGNWLSRRHPDRRSAFSAAVLILILLPALLGSFTHVQRQAAGDSRRQLFDWIAREVPPGVRIAGELKPIPCRRRLTLARSPVSARVRPGDVSRAGLRLPDRIVQ
jgi:4-amino-4-deoxy-L-arabinose transferase-like glycosyltransferase